jgi:hypothetical protein
MIRCIPKFSIAHRPRRQLVTRRQSDRGRPGQQPLAWPTTPGELNQGSAGSVPHPGTACSRLCSALTATWWAWTALAPASTMTSHSARRWCPAIRLLRDEGLIVSRQGSGVFVGERTAGAVALRPLIERALEQPKVCRST